MVRTGSEESAGYRQGALATPHGQQLAAAAPQVRFRFAADENPAVLGDVQTGDVAGAGSARYRSIGFPLGSGAADRPPVQDGDVLVAHWIEAHGDRFAIRIVVDRDHRMVMTQAAHFASLGGPHPRGSVFRRSGHHARPRGEAGVADPARVSDEARGAGYLLVPTSGMPDRRL